MKQIIAILIIAIVAVGGYFLWQMYGPGPAEVPVSIASFSCEQGKTIGATFYQTKVDLVLSDGRKLMLPQAMSASGARYANADESFVFWNKGNTAFITEGAGATAPQTYANCVTGGSDSTEPSNDTTTYSYPPLGFSIKYPKSYALDNSYQYQGLVDEQIPGIKLTIPASMATGTNLSSDSGVSIEYLPNSTSCSASQFLYQSPKASTLNDGGIAYSVASTSDAGAGNLYEEDVFALAGANPCIAVRYFIHTTQLANYPEGTRVAYDRAALLAQFDAIRHSLTLKSQ
jgi:membrane-bound inhibitor of C-type lysozyme